MFDTIYFELPVLDLSRTLEQWSANSQLSWNLAAEVAYQETYEDTDWTILAAVQSGGFVCVVLVDLYDGSVHVETVEIVELYERIIDKYLQEEARALMGARRCSIDEVEVIEISADEDEGQLSCTVRWNLTESPGRDVSFVETVSLTL